MTSWFLVLIAVLSLAPQSSLGAELKSAWPPGTTLIIRHARTAPGTGDPPGFRIHGEGACSTQRNLSAEGKKEAKEFGERFKALVPDAVLTSRWCRCKDTGQIAFGRHEVWEPLNSFFNAKSEEASAVAAMEARLRENARKKRREVWITHQVNITALTNRFPEELQIFLLSVDDSGKKRIRIFPEL